MSDSSSYHIGETGEDLAADYLINKGFKILGRNVKCGPKEIDIVALEHEIVVFVEVKFRRTTKWGMANEALSPKKLDNLGQAAERYLHENGLNDRMVRFDFIAIQQQGKQIDLKYYPNAFIIE